MNDEHVDMKSLTEYKQRPGYVKKGNRPTMDVHFDSEAFKRTYALLYKRLIELRANRTSRG